MIVLIFILIIGFLVLGIPFINGYREKTSEIDAKKLEQAKEARIRKYMTEYRSLLSNEPEKPKDYLTNLLNRNNSKNEHEWYKWHHKKMEFEGLAFVLGNNEKGIAAKRVKDSINPPKKVRQKSRLERRRGILFIPYSDFDDIIPQIDGNKLSFTDSKTGWERDMINLTKAIKILNSINLKYYSNRDKYNILYRSKILLSETTLKFEFDRNSYTIVINTGLTFKSNETEIKNRPVSFKVLEDLFEKLIDNMERELPKNRFEIILEKMKVIANK